MDKKSKPADAKIIIDDEYYFKIDGRQMTLFRNSQKDPIGYFTQFPQMLNRIVYLNSVNLANNAGNINIVRYIEIIKEETTKIEKLFTDIKNPQG